MKTHTDAAERHLPYRITGLSPAHTIEGHSDGLSRPQVCTGL